MGSEEKKVFRLKLETLVKVQAKAAADCFMCRLALESMDERNMLRDWPLGADESRYPVEAQAYHIAHEVA